MLNRKMAAAVATKGLSEPLIPRPGGLPTEVAVCSKDNSSDDNPDDNRKTPGDIFLTTFVCLLAGLGGKLFRTRDFHTLNHFRQSWPFL